MSINKERYQQICKELGAATLVAVSKTKPASDIAGLYELGQRDFGENYVQELVEKYEALPKDIHWHFIGHLQTNKVKYIAPFVYLIHGVDSLKLLQEINKQGKKNNRVIDCLLQVYIAQEETKFGFNADELDDIFSRPELKDLKNIHIRGFMGMASFTQNKETIRDEFHQLQTLFNKYRKPEINHVAGSFETLSMGMSSDYQVALAEGSNMVRIGSLLFGERN